MFGWFANLIPSRWTIAARLTVIGVVIVALAVTLTTGLAVWQLNGAMAARAQDRLDLSIKVAKELFDRYAGVGPVRLEGGHLVGANGYRLDSSPELVDKVRHLVGGTMTVFQNDMRVATSVMLPDGLRATGSLLALGPVYDTVLKEGRTFKGETDILGTPYFAVYEPLKDANDKVLGILHVGVRKAEYFSLVHEVALAVTLSSLGILLSVAGAFALVVEWCFRPLSELLKTIGHLSDGALETEIPLLERSDEMGALACALRGFKDYTVNARLLAIEHEQIRNAATTG